MRTIKNFGGALAVFAFIIGCCGAARAETTFTGTLNSAQEVPVNNSAAVGFGRVTLNDAETQITFSLTFSGLTSNQTASHIHNPGPPGVNGPVLFNIGSTGMTSGTFTGLTQNVTAQQVADLRAGRMYFNVHSANFPGGEIRGQITVDSPFVGTFSSAQEVPANNSSGTGFGRVNLNAANTQIVASFEFAGLSSNAVAGHIHQAALPGVNAGVLFGMPPPNATSGAVSDLFFAVTPEQVADLKRGLLYFNIHTTNFPGGEIRAQILPANRFGDLDADGRAELSVFRPSNGVWYSLNPGTNAFLAQQWGSDAAGDRTIPADFDGDGKADYAVWRQTDGTYYVLQSKTNTFLAQRWGNFAPAQSDETRITCDYDGDGKADFAAYRPGATATAQSFFFILGSNSKQLIAHYWGIGSDTPIMGDFDGDRRCDPTVYRRSTNSFYTLRSTDGGFQARQLGGATDIIFAADFDGDGKSDPGAFTPATGTWNISRSTGGTLVVQFGNSSDLPVPLDYDGDGRADIAVYRRSGAETGMWYILRSSNGSLYSTKFGTTGDNPIAGFLSR